MWIDVDGKGEAGIVREIGSAICLGAAGNSGGWMPRHIPQRWTLRG